MLPTKDRYLETIVNPNFQNILKKFNDLIDDTPKPDKIKDKLISIKEESTTSFITSHQRDAIHWRVNNYLNGTYQGWSKSK